MARLLADVNIADDLDVTINPDTYPEQQNPAPPPADNYTFRITKLSLRKDKDNNLVLRDGKWPVYVVEQVEILEPESSKRLVSLYQDFSTKPFNRDGAQASAAADLVRGFDSTRPVQGLLGIDAVLAEAVDQNATFHAKLDWEAYDGDYAKQALDEAGLGGTKFAEMDADDKKIASAIYAKARLKGMAKFPKKADGTPSGVWVGPSGESIEARPTLAKVYPSHATVKIAA